MAGGGLSKKPFRGGGLDNSWSHTIEYSCDVISDNSAVIEGGSSSVLSILCSPRKKKTSQAGICIVPAF